MKTRTWFIFAAVLGLVGVIFTCFFFFSGSPAGFVRSHYTRAAHYDSGRERAYTARQSPTAVASQITDDWTPAGKVVDGSGVYLRYSDDLIAIRSRKHGSLITLSDFRYGYHHYYGHVGGFWVPIGGPGERFRGRGPGAGK